jgi:hypothetical protein
VAFTALVCLLHLAGLSLLFVPPAGLLSDQPVLEQDYGPHFHDLRSLEAFWQGGRRLWGYNPSFMAGYPSNTVQESSIKLFELLAIFLPGDAVRNFKLAIFLFAAAVPWLAFFAARNFLGPGLGWSAGAAAALLATASWWNSYPREMFFYGMVGFAVAPAFALFLVSLLYRLCDDARPSAGVGLAWTAGCILFLPLHPQGVIVAALPALVLLGSALRGRHVRGLAWVAGGTVAGLAVNLPWLIPFFTHYRDQAFGKVLDAVPYFLSLDPWTFVRDYVGAERYFTFRTSVFEKGLRLALLLAGAAGIAGLARTPRRLAALALGAGAVAMFALTYFGSFSAALSGWQPLRFKVPLDLYLVLGAAAAAGRALSGPGTRLQAGALLACLVPGLAAATVNLVQTESPGNLRLRTVPPPYAVAVAQWVAREAPREGRVLFEESGDESGFVHHGMYLSSFLPAWTGRELIGGPTNFSWDRYNAVHFYAGRFIGRDIGSYSDAELRAYLATYNVGAAVVYSPQAVSRLLSVPGLATVAGRVEQTYLLTINQPLGWLARGAGKVSAGPNLIRCEEVVGPSVVLKYHWIEGLRATPPASIRPVLLLPGDPIPFIEVVAPPRSFSLSVGAPPRR